MKTTIATSEIRGTNAAGERTRLTVAVGAPGRIGDAARWQCKIAIADVLKPTVVEGADSFEALRRAVERVQQHLDGLRAQGWTLPSDGGDS
jgi:hypothetical protein